MSEKRGKLLIFSAPSGAGKSTLVQHSIKAIPNLSFSVSATSRKPRQNEQHGKHYHFLTEMEIRSKIDNGEFLEWEEVYEGTIYGTLKSDVENQLNNGKNVIFDVDVVGGLNIKKFYGDQALTIFVMPPNIDELKRRLSRRSSDSPESIEKRINKAEKELAYAPKFDVQIINDNLEQAQEECEKIIRKFLEK